MGVSLTVDVQLNAATSPWPELRERATAAEQAGFGAVWVFDHLAGASLGGDTMLEAFTLLGALAASTSTIELGTMVANVNNRTPALLADAAATVEALAGRRFHLGIGAGGSPASHWSDEMHAVGQPVEPTLAVRHSILETTLDVLDRVWDPDRPPALATFPLPRVRPEVIIGVTGPTLARLAGRRADGINVEWNDPRRDLLLEAAVESAAPRSGFTLTTWTWWDEALLDVDHPDRRAMHERRIDRLILLVPANVSADRLAAASPATDHDEGHGR